MHMDRRNAEILELIEFHQSVPDQEFLSLLRPPHQSRRYAYRHHPQKLHTWGNIKIFSSKFKKQTETNTEYKLI